MAVAHNLVAQKLGNCISAFLEVKSSGTNAINFFILVALDRFLVAVWSTAKGL